MPVLRAGPGSATCTTEVAFFHTLLLLLLLLRVNIVRGNRRCGESCKVSYCSSNRTRPGTAAQKSLIVIMNHFLNQHCNCNGKSEGRGGQSREDVKVLPGYPPVVGLSHPRRDNSCSAHS